MTCWFPTFHTCSGSPLCVLLLGALVVVGGRGKVCGPLRALPVDPLALAQDLLLSLEPRDHSVVNAAVIVPARVPKREYWIIYRVTKVLGDTDYVDIKMRVVSST